MENADHAGRRHVSLPESLLWVRGVRGCELVLVYVGTILEGKLDPLAGGSSSSVPWCYYREAGPGLTSAPLGFSSKIAQEKRSYNRTVFKKGPAELLDVNKRLLSAGNLLWPRVRLGKSQARRRGIQPLRAPVKSAEMSRKNTDLVLLKNLFVCLFKHHFHLPNIYHLD